MDLHLNLESLDTVTGKSQSNSEMSDESSEYENDHILMNIGAKKEKLPDELSLNLAGINGAEGSDNEKQQGGFLPYGILIIIHCTIKPAVIKHIK